MWLVRLVYMLCTGSPPGLSCTSQCFVAVATQPGSAQDLAAGLQRVHIRMMFVASRCMMDLASRCCYSGQALSLFVGIAAGVAGGEAGAAGMAISPSRNYNQHCWLSLYTMPFTRWPICCTPHMSSGISAGFIVHLSMLFTGHASRVSARPFSTFAGCAQEHVLACRSVLLLRNVSYAWCRAPHCCCCLTSPPPAFVFLRSGENLEITTQMYIAHMFFSSSSAAAEAHTASLVRKQRFASSQQRR